MNGNGYRNAALIAVAGLTAWAGPGCGRDARLAERELRHVTVKPVEHYGINLDETAAPEQVAYAVLRAVRDDFGASDASEREATQDVQFDLAAANVLARRNRTGRTRDEFINHVVYHWTPTVSHYVHDLPADWEAAQSRFRRTKIRTAKGDADDAPECEVLLEVADPTGDPNARVVLVVYLAKDGDLWRALHLGFARRRSLEG